MNTIRLSIFAGAAALLSAAALGQPAQPSTAPVSTAKQPEPATTQPEPPKVRVSSEPARSQGDARVQVSGVMISRARYEPSAASKEPTGAPPTPLRADGTIEVPSNTLGPGESLQSRNERLSAENRHREALATIAEEESRRPNEDFRREGVVVFGPHAGWRGSNWHDRGWWHTWEHTRRPIGPVVTEVIGFEDRPHGSALKVFSDAAGAAAPTTPGNLHREAILNAGRAATPPLIEQQRERDRVQRR